MEGGIKRAKDKGSEGGREGGQRKGERKEESKEERKEERKVGIGSKRKKNTSESLGIEEKAITKDTQTYVAQSCLFPWVPKGEEDCASQKEGVCCNISLNPYEGDHVP